MAGGKKKNNNQTLIAIAAIAVIVGGLVVYILNRGGSSQNSASLDQSSPALIRVERINKEIDIRHDLFDDLKSFTFYSPIEAVETWGRSNPFEPYQIIQQQEDTDNNSDQEEVEEEL